MYIESIATVTRIMRVFAKARRICSVATATNAQQIHRIRYCEHTATTIQIATMTHYNDVILSAMASRITSLAIVCSAIYFRRRSKKTSKLRATGLCAGNSPVTGEFPAQKASNAENVSIWWRHHDLLSYANPEYGVATICHQVRCLPWGHLSLFHTATSLLIWYKMFQCCWELFSTMGPFNVFMKFQWVPAVHTCLEMFNVMGPSTQKDAGLVPVNFTAVLHERYIIQTYMDEIYKHVFRVCAIWDAQAF